MYSKKYSFLIALFYRIPLQVNKSYLPNRFGLLVRLMCKSRFSDSTDLKTPLF